VTREEARALFSDYLEDTLNPQTRDEMQAFLSQDPDCAAELFGLERTLSLLHRLPPREPALDLWREFAPLVEEFRATRRLDWAQRLRLRGEEWRAQISGGVILWTHALSERARARLERYVFHDHSLSHRTEEGRK